MRRQFGKTIVKLAERDENLVLLIGDVEQEMKEYKNRFPDRFYNLGLCEQTMISMAAGMSLEALRPVVYSITPFLIERPFEQIKIDIDEQNLPVILVGYADYPSHGPTHRPLNAEGLVNLFKNIKGYFPKNSEETEKAMIEAYDSQRPAIICLKREGPPFGK
jgi:transketolase